MLCVGSIAFVATLVLASTGRGGSHFDPPWLYFRVRNGLSQPFSASHSFSELPGSDGRAPPPSRQPKIKQRQSDLKQNFQTVTGPHVPRQHYRALAEGGLTKSPGFHLSARRSSPSFYVHHLVSAATARSYAKAAAGDALIGFAYSRKGAPLFTATLDPSSRHDGVYEHFLYPICFV